MVTMRPETAADEPFLRRLIFETIAAELGASQWPEPMRSHLLGIQYRARRQPQGENSSRAASKVIDADGADAGWAMFMPLADEIRLIEIMILPELRGRGIGTAAMRLILAIAAEHGKPVRLHVNVANYSAIRLYERLGFRRTGGDDVQQTMQYLPPEL